VPIFVSSDAAGNKYKEQCDRLSAADYFETSGLQEIEGEVSGCFVVAISGAPF